MTGTLYIIPYISHFRAKGSPYFPIMTGDILYIILYIVPLSSIIKFPKEVMFKNCDYLYFIVCFLIENPI